MKTNALYSIAKTHKKKLEELLKIREKNYQKADFTIDTLDKKAYTILNDIIQEYERNAKEPIKS